ncbi:hypothetical protein ACJRO7_030231, partial [Eucalyptus globulus]
ELGCVWLHPISVPRNKNFCFFVPGNKKGTETRLGAFLFLFCSFVPRNKKETETRNTKFVFLVSETQLRNKKGTKLCSFSISCSLRTPPLSLPRRASPPATCDERRRASPPATCDERLLRRASPPASKEVHRLLRHRQRPLSRQPLLLHQIETSEELEKVSTADERQSFIAKLDEVQEWLYMDGEDVTAAEFQERLNLLKAIGDPIFFRLKELTERPAAVGHAQSYLDQLQKVSIKMVIVN